MCTTVRSNPSIFADGNTTTYLGTSYNKSTFFDNTIVRNMNQIIYFDIILDDGIR